MNQTICKAIANQQTIQFYYDGGIRTVEPHCHGLTTKGSEGLRGYQTSGHTESGKMGWKMFDLSKTYGITILSDNFSGPRAGYKKNDSGMSRIFCKI